MPGTITTDLTIFNSTGGDAESLTNWTTTAAWSGNPAVSNDVFLQGSNAINARASSATPGTIALYWDHLTTGTANLDLTGKHAYYWIKCFSLPSMEKRVRGGIGISISSTAGVTKTGTDPWSGINDSKQWFVSGSDFEPLSGWVCYVVDPFSTADLSLGTPDMTSVDRIGIRAGALQTVGGGSVKPLPVLWDALRYGTGLTVNDGTGGSPVTLEDLYAADSATSAQWGIISKAGGIFFLAGKLRIGTTGQTAVTVLTDTNQVIVCQDFPVGADFYELVLNGASSFGTTVTLGSYSGGLTAGGCTIRGSGLSTQRLIAPVIVSGGSGYTAADILTVSGGTLSPGGLASQFKVIAVSSGVITEARMERAGSYSTPPTGTLSVTGGTGGSATFTATARGGAIWTLTASAANQTLNLYGCSLSEMRSAALASTSVVRGCTFSNFGNITANGALFDGCTFRDLAVSAPISATYAIVVATSTPTITNSTFINCATAVSWDRAADTNGKLDGCTFISGGTGHAIELKSNTPSEISLTDVLFSGYGADGTTDAAIYNNAGKAIIINILGDGSTPTVRNGTGASTTIVAGTVSCTITVKDIDTGGVISGARVLVTASDNTGPMPFDETVTQITRVSSTATVSHTGHGLVDGKKVLIKGAVQQEYNGVYTLTYINANSYSYTVSGTPDTPATGTIKATGVVIDGDTNGSGVISDTRTHASDQPITGRVRKSTGGTPYKTGSIVGIVSSATGFSATVQLIKDL